MGDALPKTQINFLRGWPNPSLLPASAIEKAAKQALSDPQVSTPALLYGPDPGYQPLRESIAEWLSGFYAPATQRSHEVSADPERICITGGASQNLACILQVYTDPVVTRVWMVAPSYFLACRIFDDAGLVTRAVDEGEDGIDLEGLERILEQDRSTRVVPKAIKRPKPWSKIYRHVIYCVPTFSNPSGRSMSLSARQSLVQLARKHDALIITDDVYDFLQWPTSDSTSSLNPTTTLKSALLPRLVDVDRTLPRQREGADDGFGNTVSNGSFSKIVGPGVRTGWGESTTKFAYGLSQCGSSRSGGAPSQMTATIINSLLRSGDLERHIEFFLKPEYQKRHTLMKLAILTHLVPLGIHFVSDTLPGSSVFGGYFIWLELPRNIDAEAVSGKCKEEENLIVAPGNIFEVQGDDSIKFPSSIRLCFSWEAEADLEEGVIRLARVIRDAAAGKEGSAAPPVTKRDLGEFQ